MPFNIMLHTIHCIQYASIMPFNIKSVQYHAAYSMQALCRSISLHTVCKHYAVQYHAAYSTQALCHSISCCIQYAIIMPFSIMLFNIMLHTVRAGIMPFNIMLHTVRKHYAVRYHAACSKQALCCSISCCMQ